MTEQTEATTPGAADASPVVVRSDSRDPAARAAKLAGELAPVIEIMNATGITAAGIKVTGPGEVELNQGCEMRGEQEAIQRLTAARDRILRELDRSVGLYAAPNAMLTIRGRWDTVAVTLLGDKRPGITWCPPVKLVSP